MVRCHVVYLLILRLLPLQGGRFALPPLGFAVLLRGLDKLSV
ncbi:MAG: hypothetical protein EORIYHIE_002281, partial [Candidatus Fervidibacter sp.]